MHGPMEFTVGLLILYSMMGITLELVRLSVLLHDQEGIVSHSDMWSLTGPATVLGKDGVIRNKPIDYSREKFGRKS